MSVVLLLPMSTSSPLHPDLPPPWPESLGVCTSARCLQAGVTSDTLASAAVGATNVLGTVLAASLIEGQGRKQLLVGSYLGQGVAMLVMAAGAP